MCARNKHAGCRYFFFFFFPLIAILSAHDGQWFTIRALRSECEVPYRPPMNPCQIRSASAHRIVHCCAPKDHCCAVGVVRCSQRRNVAAAAADDCWKFSQPFPDCVSRFPTALYAYLNCSRITMTTTVPSYVL